MKQKESSYSWKLQDIIFVAMLCVVFGVYRPIMELLSSPFRALKTYYKMLIPLILGGGVGFVLVSKALGFLLDRYPDASVCVFVGLIAGMLPSLFREAGEKGRSKSSFVSMGVCFAVVLGLLLGLQAVHAQITPNIGWYLFCGFCLALSVIAPGMSFSTLLMPLGLYTPFVDGIGHLDMSVCIPGGIGALVTVICLAKAVNALFEHQYSLAFHAIVGIVVAATIMIVPIGAITASFMSAVIDIALFAVGVVAALMLDSFNQRVMA